MKKEKAKRIAKRITAFAAAAAMAATFTFPAEVGDGFFDGFGNAIVASAAENGTIGTTINWTLNDSGTLIISGTGAMTDWAYGNDSPWKGNTSIKTVVIESGVTSLGGWAFIDCANITSVTIPDSVTTIGDMAFCRCSGLTEVNIPASVISIKNRAFWHCENLKSVVFSEGSQLSTIESEAFQYCKKLESINIPDGVKSINSFTFHCCQSLKSVTLPSNLTSISYNSFDQCNNLLSITVPDSVISIGSNSFSNCTSLTSIFLPESLTSIGTEAIPGAAAQVKYTVTDNKVMITEIIPGTGQTSADIPEKISGYPVVSVAAAYQQYVGNHTHNFDSNNVCAICGGLQVTSIAVNPSTLTLSVGQTDNLIANVQPPNATDTSVEWTSSNTSVATVDDSGNVTAVGRGTATIKATAKDGSGIYGECAVTVNARSYNISISAEIRNGRIMADSTAKADDTVTITVTPDQGYKLKNLTVNDSTNNQIVCNAITEVNKYIFTMPKSNVTISAEFEPTHTLSKVERVEPTCTADGNKEYWSCDGCSLLFSDKNGINETTLAAVTIPATNHNWSTAWEKDKDYHWYKCLNTGCNEIKDKAKHSSNAAATEVSPEVCKDCEYVMAPALGHIHANHLTFVAEVPETCTTDGVKAHYKCDCGKLFEDAAAAAETTLSQLKIPAHHSYGTEWVSDNDENHYHVCSVCGDKADITAHSFGDGVVTAEPTEKTEGVLTYTCEICGYEKTEAIPVLTEEEAVVSFVDRLYRNILGRTPDENKDSHVDNLENGKSATEVAYDFVFSPEFTELDVTNEERVRIMYNTFLDREPDPEGLATWTKVLDEGNAIGHIFIGFTQSNEFGEICEEYGIEQGTMDYTDLPDENKELIAFVARLYTKALGRGYDIDGLNDHKNGYVESGDLYQMAFDFIFSPEYLEKNLSDEDFVENMYEVFFDRSSDSAGKADWVGRLKSGASREDVLAGFVGSQECAELVAKFGI